jgi:hypothetical protein
LDLSTLASGHWHHLCSGEDRNETRKQAQSKRKSMVPICWSTTALAIHPAASSSLPNPETAAAGVLLLWLGLFVALGLLLFWGLPLAVAGLIARHREEHPAAALLWAGALGWIGLLVYLCRRAEKPCPHCHTRILAETALCYWCGGDTRPAPLPQWGQERSDARGGGW